MLQVCEDEQNISISLSERCFEVALENERKYCVRVEGPLCLASFFARHLPARNDSSQQSLCTSTKFHDDNPFNSDLQLSCRQAMRPEIAGRVLGLALVIHSGGRDDRFNPFSEAARAPASWGWCGDLLEQLRPPSWCAASDQLESPSCAAG